jgi:hypothetical protein
MNSPNQLTRFEDQPSGVVPFDGATSFRASTNAASLCGEIVRKTAKPIQGRKYVTVEGWQAIAIAHGCTASARDVEAITGGIRAIGEVRRMSDQAVISVAEGFLGDDEGMWAKRPLFARRAMAQTRAISRACRSAFAHVVVMIDADLGTTPAEEMEGAIGHEKVATVTGEVKNKKPAWNDDQKKEAGRLRGECMGFKGGDERVGALWKRMAYDAPSDVIDALSNLLRDLQEENEPVVIEGDSK